MKRFLGLRGNSLNVVAILGVALPGLITVGYNQTLLGGVLILKSFEHQFRAIDVADAESAEKDYKSTVQGTIVALYAVGGLLGALSCIWLGDRLGRRRIIMATSAVQVIGSVLMASACGFSQLIVSRLVLGAGTGGLLATIPVYQSEISPTSKRGVHVATTGVFIGLGLTTALWVDFGMSFMDGTVAWRFPFALQALLSLIVIGFIGFLPESPRWLIRQGRVSEAREILAALDDTTPENEGIQAEIEDVKLSLELAGKGSLSQIFHMGPQRIFHRIALAATLMMFLQLTGVNVITLYTTTIFEVNLRLDRVTSRILAAVYQLISPISGTLCILTIEGFGRRGLMLLSSSGCCISMALIAGLSSQPHNSLAMHGAIFFTFLFHFSHALGFGGIPFLYATEVAPLNLRTAINSISVGMFWAFNVLIAEITPIAFTALGWRYFVIFAGLNAFMIPIIYYFFPETAGRSLEEVDEIFTMSESILDAVPLARRLPHRQPVDLPHAEFCAQCIDDGKRDHNK